MGTQRNPPGEIVFEVLGADVLADVVKDTTAKEEGIDLVEYGEEEVAARGDPAISNEKLVTEFDAMEEVVSRFN